MKTKNVLLLILLITFMSGCLSQQNESIINRHAEALLTKNNELQFRFKVNEEILENQKMYKVRVTIHSKELAMALGTNEIIYGEESVYDGEYLEVEGEKDDIIYMDPIPLKKDLHTFELQRMIADERAVSVEVFNDQEVFGDAYLTNFSSEF